jgi:hypothetical protein
MSAGRGNGGVTAPWWTEADAAELDVLVWEMVSLYYEHREHPDVNRALGEAVDAILDWRRGRMLRSRGIYLRLREELAEVERRIARARA